MNQHRILIKLALRILGESTCNKTALVGSYWEIHGIDRARIFLGISDNGEFEEIRKVMSELRLFQESIIFPYGD
jgi:hypothetical protein